MRRQIYCTSGCNGYWYHARHGIGPGTIPNDVHLLKCVDDPENRWKDYICLDRFLTTQELRDYDLVEKCPPSIECATSIKASTSIDCMDYYQRMSPEEEAYAFSFIDDQALENMGYGDHHILGWYEAKPEYAEALGDQGLDSMMLIDDGTCQFLGYVVGDRLFELEPYDIEGSISDYT